MNITAQAERMGTRNQRGRGRGSRSNAISGSPSPSASSEERVREKILVLLKFSSCVFRSSRLGNISSKDHHDFQLMWPRGSSGGWPWRCRLLMGILNPVETWDTGHVDIHLSKHEGRGLDLSDRLGRGKQQSLASCRYCYRPCHNKILRFDDSRFLV